MTVELFIVVPCFGQKTPSEYVYETTCELEKKWSSVISKEGWKQDKPVEDESFSGKPALEEEKAGVIVFNRNWCFYTYVYSSPRETERNKPFSIKVTPGEKEPMSVSLYCLEDLKNVKAIISSTKPEGISTSSWTTYTVVSNHMPWEKKLIRTDPCDDKIYDIIPTHLLDLPKGIEGKKNKCLQFIFDLKCPLEAKAGIYKGEFTITTSKGSIKVPYTVEVLPFTLMNVDEIWQRGWFEGGSWGDLTVEDLNIFKEFGFNSIAYFWWTCQALFGTTHGLCNKNGDLLFVKEGREENDDRTKNGDFKEKWLYIVGMVFNG